ncbi:MAG: lamin tail domain-containing protein, partial [Leptospiraceae bacterium]|nr:lamin tail domain-containing protein [Leptospiraceae bacterium]
MDVRKLHISDYATIRLVGRKWTAKFALVCIFSLAPNCSMIGLTEEADADRATIEIILAFLNAENENDTSQIDRTPKLPDAAGDLLFSELQYNPAGPENLGEWIELYNPTNFIWNLKGCVLDESGGDDHTIASDVLVAPHDYAVLATIDSPEGVVPDYSYNDALRWNNTGETATIL